MGNHKSLLAMVGALLLLTGTGSLFAQAGKIGFVNSQEILYQTNEGKEGVEQLERYMTQKRQEFDGKNKALADLQQEYQTKQGTLNPDAAAKMQRDIEQLQLEIRRFQEDIQTDLNDRQEQLLGVISQKVQGVIEEYAKANSFDAVFMRDQSQVWVSPSLDVTQDIIRLYNEKHPGKGGAAAQPAPQPQQ
jgi:outer membrane protein